MKVIGSMIIELIHLSEQHISIQQFHEKSYSGRTSLCAWHENKEFQLHHAFRSTSKSLCSDTQEKGTPKSSPGNWLHSLTYFFFRYVHINYAITSYQLINFPWEKT